MHPSPSPLGILCQPAEGRRALHMTRVVTNRPDCLTPVWEAHGVLGGPTLTQGPVQATCSAWVSPRQKPRPTLGPRSRSRRHRTTAPRTAGTTVAGAAASSSSSAPPALWARRTLRHPRLRPPPSAHRPPRGSSSATPAQATAPHPWGTTARWCASRRHPPMSGPCPLTAGATGPARSS